MIGLLGSLDRTRLAMAVYSTKRAAEILKVSPDRVRKLAQAAGAGLRIGKVYRFAWGDLQMMRVVLKHQQRTGKRQHREPAAA